MLLDYAPKRALKNKVYRYIRVFSYTIQYITYDSKRVQCDKASVRG